MIYLELALDSKEMEEGPIGTARLTLAQGKWANEQTTLHSRVHGPSVFGLLTYLAMPHIVHTGFIGRRYSVSLTKCVCMCACVCMWVCMDKRRGLWHCC